MNIARVRNGIVENIEVATEEWLQNYSLETNEQVVLLSGQDAPHIGLSWSEATGFEQPEPEPIPSLVLSEGPINP